MLESQHFSVHDFLSGSLLGKLSFTKGFQLAYSAICKNNMRRTIMYKSVMGKIYIYILCDDEKRTWNTWLILELFSVVD